MHFEPFVFFAACLLALGTGMLTGAFGVGGGILLIPCLVIFLKVPGAIAVGTNLLVVLAVSSVSLLQRRGTATVDHKLAIMGCIGSAAGVIFGQRLLQYLKGVPAIQLAGKDQSLLEYVLLWMFLAILSWVAILLFVDYRRNRMKVAAQGVLPPFVSFRMGPWMIFPTVTAGALSLPAVLMLGGGIGFLIGLPGVAGGVFWLPALLYLVGQKPAVAAGTSLLIIWISSLIGSGLNVWSGNVDWPLCGFMVAGGILGSWYGTRIGLRLDGARLKYYFIYVLLAAIVIVGAKVLAMTMGW